MDNQPTPTPITTTPTPPSTAVVSQNQVIAGSVKQSQLVAPSKNMVAGDLVYGDGSNNFVALGVGQNNNFLTLTSGVPSWTAFATLAQGDILYFNGTKWINLAHGTTGQYLQTQGASANPQWAGLSGKILQLVAATYATQTSSASGTLADTGLTATITPTLSSSKILVTVAIATNTDAVNTGGVLKLLRAGSVIYTPIFNFGYNTASSANRGMVSFSYLDSPATTSATIYKMQYAVNTGSGNVVVQSDNATSSIVLQEIGI